MDKITDKIVHAEFLIRTLGEQIYAGQAKPKDFRKVRKKVNSILRELAIMAKNDGE